MVSAEIVRWAIVVFSFGLMAFYASLVGCYIVQTIYRLKRRRILEPLQKWGVEDEVFRPKSNLIFILFGLALIAAILFTFSLAFISTLLISESPFAGGRPFSLKLLADSSQLGVTLNIAMFSVWTGFWIEYVRLGRICDKVKALNGLRDVFHQRFSVMEILSIYESMMPAPKLFWEAYTNLPENDINEETNRKFRELVAPYRYSQSRSHNQYISIATAIIIGLTAISVFIGTMVWLSG